MSDKAHWGYIAGIIDGEGTLSIGRSEYDANRKAENGRPARTYHTTGFHSRVSVKNTDLRLMKWFKSRVGGEWYKDTSKRPENWKDSYVWVYGGIKLKEEFLLAILPYLVIKREQALVLLEFIKLGNVRDSDKRQAFYEKIVALNQRGKPVETNTQDSSEDEEKIESVLTGDGESAPVVTQIA